MLLTLLKKFTNGALKYFRAFCLDDLKRNYQRTEIRWTNLSIVYYVFGHLSSRLPHFFHFRISTSQKRKAHNQYKKGNKMGML